ncbi:uncharacterized protein LOC109787715 [Cajanus cajan]|uniref:uncharacterized protein LOC109787715 n=1 Tax=Cajanus cajan TaxID=3821 RepID=UPI00098DD175|nr:uncharacterized protein LOC109787715 [Cajanus cajan]
MAASKTEQQVTLKLMVIKKRNKVLFAEAGKDFVDVLFSFLTLPLGTIARLVRKESNMVSSKVGSLSSLYESVENLDEECLCDKEMLLRPRNSMDVYCKNVELNIDDTNSSEYFVCNNLVKCRYNSPVFLSTNQNNRCTCGAMLAKPIFPKRSEGFDGFVKKCNGSFLITDELKVLPNSLVTFLHLLKSYGIKDMSSLDEVILTITKNQVLDLLKGCLYSKTTLTDVFLEQLYFEKLFTRNEFVPCDFDANVSSCKIKVKIMQRKSNGKILFAQGNKDFVDFLFSFLTIPLGGVVHLMEGCSFIGSVDGLYKSVINLDEDYWTSKEVKIKFANPVLAHVFKLSNMLLPICSDVPKYYCCTIRHNLFGYLTDSYLTSTHKKIDSTMGNCTALVFVDSICDTGNSDGYAKGPTMYIATDDLVVMPMSSISVISLLNSMSIPVNDLIEKEVSIGVKEGVRILQASLMSTSALTIGLSHLTKVEKN